MIRGRRPAGTPFNTLMSLNTLSAATFSFPAIECSTTFIRLSRSAAKLSPGTGANCGMPPGGGMGGMGGIDF